MSSPNDHLTRYYDEVPYQSHPFPQTTVEHLATRAFMFGLEARHPSSARVLEIGCAGGGNLIPFAARFPESEAVGFDLSSVQIEQGRAEVRRAGLKNIDLRVMDVADIDESLGQFDYIVCHGVYSWVPGVVQDAILRVCEKHLAPDGIAYVSYNVYPGWKAREIVRDAMILRGGPRETPEEKLAFGRGMLEFLEQSSRPDSVLRKAMDETMPIIRGAHSSYLLHEFFEPYNAPCYFKEFVDRAGRHGLAYLAESDSSSMFVQNYAEGVREPLLKECGGSQVVMEQYLDFLVNRTFRQTLLVKAERAGRIRYQLDPQRIGSMHYAGTYAARDGNALVLDSTEQPCTASFGRVVTLRHPVHKAVALTLSAQFPAASSLDEIIVGVLSHLDEPESVVRPLVLAMIEELLIVGAVHVRSVKPEVASRVSALPRALEGNRRAFESFAHGERPTATCNQWHEQVALSPLETFLMPLLDGTRSLETLEAEVTAATRADQLRFARDGKPMEWRDVPSGFVRDETMLALQGLQRKGLLVA